MANTALFVAAWARCREHRHVLLEADEQECLRCRILRRNLSITPPFDVLCIRSEHGVSGTKKGELYTVQWVIKEGVKKGGEFKGYGLISGEGEGRLVNHCFDPENFIPLEYMNDDETDKWDKSIKLTDDPVYDYA